VRLRKFKQFLPRVVGIVLVLAALVTATDTTTMHQALSFYGFAIGTIYVLVWVIVLTEAALGQTLLLGLGGRIVPAATLALLLVFCAHLGFLYHSTHPPDCGCPGLIVKFRDAHAQAIFGLGRNAVLVVALLPSLTSS
jgi:hypothetical protein